MATLASRRVMRSEAAQNLMTLRMLRTAIIASLDKKGDKGFKELDKILTQMAKDEQPDQGKSLKTFVDNLPKKFEVKYLNE